jgi:hypothetical protein
MAQAKWLFNLAALQGLTIISWFFVGVLQSSSNLFSLAGWDSFYAAHNLRMLALKDFGIAAIVILVVSFLVHYKIRPTLFQITITIVSWAAIVGWFCLKSGQA